MSDEGGGRYIDLKNATYLATRLGERIGLIEERVAPSEKRKEQADEENQLKKFHEVPKEKKMSRAEKEKLFIVVNIKKRLVDLVPESHYDIKKGICGVVAFLFLVAGTVICLKALGLTVIFASDPFNPTLLIIGASFGAPCLIWFFYIFVLPHLCFESCRKIKTHREYVHEKRRERKEPGLFNNMVGAANKHSEPPIVRTRLFAMYRKKEYTIVSHQMKEFQEMFFFKTGLPPQRQLFKLRDEDGSSEIFDFSPEDYILDMGHRGVKKDTVFWIYGKGGFEYDVESSPDFRMAVPRKKDRLTIDETLMDSVQVSQCLTFRILYLYPLAVPSNTRWLMNSYDTAILLS